jgi:LmbE family N-acetylglucosaminyl deacetylase
MRPIDFGPALLATLGAPAGRAWPPPPPTVLVAAHPDDESLGAATRLPRLAQARFVCVTDGAPRDGRDAARRGLTPDGYARLRERELECALALCGIAPTQLVRLGIADQQAALNLTQVATQLAALFTEFGAEAVLTHAYEGGHPDHDACAFGVHAAAALLRARGAPAPAIVEMAGYHWGPEGLRTAAFLPARDATPDEVAVHLTPEEQAHKRALLACHASQEQTLRPFPLDVERFRIAPHYDFLQPPHAGLLYYERHAWGMEGKRFRALAAEALAALGLEHPR